MKKNIFFRGWFYFRTGWATYFAFIFAAINTLTVTYYLAIENIVGLKEIFPDFISYIFVITLIGIPSLTAVGYIHYKKSLSYKSEADITLESNPHLMRLLTNTEMILPYYVEILDLLIKTSKNEKLTSDEIKKILLLKDKMNNYISKKTID